MVKKYLSEIKYAFYLTVHPIKGFWDIKHEKRGSLQTALLILLLYIISSSAGGLYGGYLFNAGGGVNFNIYKNSAAIVFIYILWCAANWCLTSLFDGEGTFRDICSATAYALFPLMLTQFLLIPMSHAFSISEMSFYTMVYYIGLLWSLMLLFLGINVIHQYTVLKTVVIMIFSLAGACVIAYIILLFLDLIQQILGFVITFWRELQKRI